MHNNMQIFEARAFLLLIVASSVLFGWLLLPFFDVLFWAVVIAVLFSPVYARLREKYGMNPNIASLLTVTLCFFIIILPLAWLLYSCVAEGTALYVRLSSDTSSLMNAVDRLKEHFPEAQAYLAQYGCTPEQIKETLSKTALSMASFIAKNTMAFGGSAAHILTNLALVLYTSFFLVRDGKHIRNLLIRAMPFGDHREKRLLTKFAGVMRATVKGSLFVAICQGALGGCIFWILGIRAAVLWGVVMAILSLIPVVGSALIWLPTALYLIVVGHYWQGGLLIAYGACVISLADNILRPLLVGRDTKLPDVLVLLSTLGGFMLFGMDGFVTGPTLAVLFVTVWQIFMEECACGTYGTCDAFLCSSLESAEEDTPADTKSQS